MKQHDFKYRPNIDRHARTSVCRLVTAANECPNIYHDSTQNHVSYSFTQSVHANSPFARVSCTEGVQGGRREVHTSNTLHSVEASETYCRSTGSM
jgi:hypothetical protein